MALLGLIGWFGWIQVVEPPLSAVSSRERALALIVGRTMDLNEAVKRLPAWERRLYELSLEEGASDLAQAIRWYEELAGFSDDPLVRVRLAILEGEAGRLSRVREQADAWEHDEPPLPAFARLIAAAYLETPDDSGVWRGLSAALPQGWFHDRLETRLATRAGGLDRLEAVRRAQAARLEPLVRQVRRVALVELTVLLAGLLALVTVVVRARHHPAAMTVAAAAVPPRWSGRAGAVVLIRGGALAAIVTAALAILPPLFDVAHPALDMLTTPAGALPLILLARRHLLGPAGQGFVEAFGLWPPPGCRGRLALAALALVAVGLLGDLALSLAGAWVGLPTHWTEWFDADLAWGTPLEVASSVVSVVVFAPVFEELVFRGLLYATLRRKLAWVPSAALSGAIFAFAHGYGVAGFVNVLVSGVLWAGVYERTRSLLPGIVAHATNNVAASLTVLWILRG